MILTLTACSLMLVNGHIHVNCVLVNLVWFCFKSLFLSCELLLVACVKDCVNNADTQVIIFNLKIFVCTLSPVL